MSTRIDVQRAIESILGTLFRASFDFGSGERISMSGVVAKDL